LEMAITQQQMRAKLPVFRANKHGAASMKTVKTEELPHDTRRIAPLSPAGAH
jgi:hypothetical protein